MPILKACEIHYPKLNPKRPNARYNKKNPTWEVQLRTTSVTVKKHWEAMHLKPKAVLNEEAGTVDYYRVNLRRKSIKADGEPSDPVKVVNGALEPIDPDTIGNGSIGNIRIFQYEYKNDDGEGVATVLMAIQLTKHVVYTRTAGDDDFDMEETETVEENEEFDDSEPSSVAPSPAPKSSSPSVGNSDYD